MPYNFRSDAKRRIKNSITNLERVEAQLLFIFDRYKTLEDQGNERAADLRKQAANLGSAVKDLKSVMQDFGTLQALV